MKRWLLIGVVLFSPLLGMAADEEGHEGLSVEAVLQEIMASQGVERIQDVDPDRVAPELLEELGDAVMEEAHPGEAHEIMDAMMGGEGSESLAVIHRAMGYRYLVALVNGREDVWGWGMMGPGMMGAGMGPWMMYGWAGGQPGTFWYRYGGIIMMIFGFLILAGIIAALIVLVQQNRGIFRSLGGQEDPLSVLKARLARGEITEEEYERLKSRILSS
ncbi:SHOCT domain-containing protein [Spirochaeta thermophila]|uniref:SHOCT domain-containing protein n=1 Tax=Winmispira thermophila (strain ATCC 49972 / DSM 6192 / RI 19.B1) TaxID=665571 RepID=E0RTR3_WINT6|nr:SHOCT domain-containing protein [Spirochaeta thermophila]ADN02438.1 hypothetical protein STHERM_c14980 [Spirochaeta thermophila DSM 6192]